MKINTRYYSVILLVISIFFSCVKRQEIPLYEEKKEKILAADSLYNFSKKLYKDGNYREACEPLKEIIKKYPICERIDDALHLLLLSKYRLKDYRGVLSTVSGKERLYRKSSNECNILYVTALSLNKLNKKYDAADHYFKILGKPKKSSMKNKVEQNLKIIIEEDLGFKDLENLASRYDKISMGCFLLFHTVKKGVAEGKEYEAKKVYNRMKSIYPNNEYTIKAEGLLKIEKMAKVGETIVFLAPLTGKYSVFGRMVKRGFELGLKGTKLRVVEGNTKGDPIQTIKQLISIIKKEKVFVIVGPVLSMPMIAASGISNLEKIPIISPTATEEDISSIGPYVFQLNVGLGAQAKEMAKFATGELGLYKVGILYPDDAYGNSLANIFTEEVTKYGGNIVAKQGYSEGTTDFSNQMKFLKEKKPNIVYIPCYPNEAIMIAPELRYYKIRAQILGADGWNDEKVPLKGEKYVEGVIFTGNPTIAYKSSELYKDFRRFYFSQYKTEPTREAALGYDTAILLRKAFSKGVKNTESLTTILREIKPFAGASGIVNPRGIFEGSVPFFTIKKGEIVRLK